MVKIDLANLTIEKASAAMAAGEFTAVDLAQNYLEAIKEQNANLNAYLGIYDDVMAQAEAADKRRAAGENHPLLGIPFAIKDNILVKGQIASAASKILENYRATYDATVIAKLKKAGAVFLGRANMDEFAMGGSTENSAFGVTKNPFDNSKVAGGSSGGSAAAVAANLSLVALGSDTGGSIRQPASFCGLVGLKGTYGTVSRYGVMAMASSFDQIGPLTKTVEEAKLIFNTISGRDDNDATSIDSKPATVPSKLVIGVPTDFVGEGLDGEVKRVLDETIAKFKAAGHEVKEISLPALKHALSCYYVLMPAEASSNVSRFDGVRFGLHVDGANLFEDYTKTRGVGFGPEVRRRIILGTYVLSAGYYDAYYGKACAVRAAIVDEYKKAFAKDGQGVDVILTPTAPTPAFAIGKNSADPLQMYLEDIFTVPINIAGVPALSVPAGKTDSGLPIGMQLTGPHFGEEILFAAGQVVEK